MKRLGAAIACVIAFGCVAADGAQASFPYLPSGGNASDFSTYKSAAGVVPNDLGGNEWKFAATGENPNQYAAEPKELNGVRGAHVVDASAAATTAWMTTTGRPDVTIAVLDSGIEWNNAGAMDDLRFKLRLNKGELPLPQVTGPTRDTTAAADCSGFVAGSYDANGDGVFNTRDYACDPRVNVTDPRRAGPAGKLIPQDITIAFSDGTDADGNGFVDDIAGWDFLDDDNDPYDDVQYGHGTGEARDSSAEANNGGDVGSCPNCTFVPLRVGDSFVADVNNFAQASTYAVDNNVLVIQEALGTLNNSRLARDAVEYAYRHGVAFMASAADEAAQHHNWPSSMPHAIVTNSVVKYDSTFTPGQKSYVEFNGCTNFASKVTVSIPSSSCSSNAVGLAAGMAGLIYSAALDAKKAGTLDPSPSSTCKRPDGNECLITPNEVRQLIASGKVTPGHDATHVNAPNTQEQADDINFISGAPEPSCTPVPAPDCTDPNRFFPLANAPGTGRPVLAITGPNVTRSYGAHAGFDQYYGYGRVNMVKALESTTNALMPPEAEITAPEWYEQIDPARPNLDVSGFVNARGHGYTCVVEVAPGSDPTNDADFTKVTSSNWCDNTTQHSAEHSGVLAQINLADLKAKFPPNTDFTGTAPTPLANTSSDGPHQNNRPAKEPYGFTVRVRVTSAVGGKTLRGEDRRNMYLHRDAQLKQGFPKEFGTDGASSPLLIDLDGDNRNEMVFGTSDGRVYAMRPDGSEMPGFPVHSDPLPLHTGGAGFKSGEVSDTASYSAILASVAAGDLDHDGVPEIVAADLNGKVYAWSAKGDLEWKREANPAYSGKPLRPFENVRCGTRCRTQHGFIASPVLANLDGSKDGKLDVIAAAMDRHVYAWKANGDSVDGYPVLVIDRDKITAVDPQTHVPTFKTGIGDALNQGAIVDTPAVGNLDGDPAGKLEIVVGTNEEYSADDDGGMNAGLSSGSIGAIGSVASQAGLSPGNSRLYAIKSGGDPAGVSMKNSDVFLPGWPVKIGVLLTELLPVVGEGVTGSPVIGGVTCASGGGGPKVGAVSDAGPGYIFNADGSSCYGKSSGLDGQQHDKALSTDGEGFSAQGPKYDTPVLAAVGHPAFGNFDPSGATGPTFFAPTTGLIRALDLAFPEYQGGQDFLAAWNGSSGEFQPGYPVPVNDLQFLTGPSVGNVDALPGDEAVGGTASLDLNAVNGAGQPASGFPKLSSDWMVTNPVIGSFGGLETDSSTHNIVGAMTRRGTLFVYDTPAPACPLGSWPRFHHDNANSGVLDRDAVSPGAISDAKVQGSALSFKAPGDDLLCGNVDHYEVVTSDAPVLAGDFGGPAVLPAKAAPGANETLQLDFALDRFVAVRAVDDQGNVGRIALVDRSPSAAGGGSAGGQNGGNNGGGSGAGGGSGSGTGSGHNPASGSGCTSDKRAPRSSISRRAVHAAGRRFSVRGHSRDRGCARLRRVYVQISKLAHGRKCRFVTRSGRLTHRRSCRRPHLIRAKGLRGWSLKIKRRLPRGKYTLTVRGLDRKGNRERVRKGNTFRFRVR